MKFYITFLAVIISLSLSAQEKSYYPNGNIKESGNYTDGKKTGKWKYYHDNNILMSEGKYKNGKKDGVWKEYYKSGKLLNIIQYKDGDQKYGKDKQYYENGQLKVIMKYKKGKLHGKQITYFADGHIKQKNRLKNGVFTGKSIEYWENHNIKLIRNDNENGITEFSRFHENGVKSVDGYTNRVTNNLDYKTFDENGNVTGIYKKYNKNTVEELPNEKNKLKEPEIYYINGNPNDFVKTVFDESGAIQKIDTTINYKHYSTTEYRNDTIIHYTWKKGLKDGLYTARYRNGSIAEKGNYKRSGKIGLWQSYYKNGQLQFEGMFEYDSIQRMGGFKNGTHKYHYPDGTLQNIEHYEITHYESKAYREGKPKKSVKTGTWYSYYPDGKVKRKVTYTNNQKNGLLKEYHYNGNTAHVAHYINDRIIGLEEFFYENNNVEHTVIRDEEGYRQGKEIYYYEDGQLKSEGSYLSNIKSGKWKHYNETGKLILEEYYDSDLYEYKATYYLLDGKIVAEVTGEIFDENNRNYILYFPDGKTANLYDKLDVDKEKIIIQNFGIVYKNNNRFSFTIEYENKITGSKGYTSISPMY